MKIVWKINYLTIKRNFEIILLNTFIWVGISLIPVFSGLIYSFAIDDLAEGKKTYLVLSLSMLLVGFIHGAMIVCGGRSETKTYFKITQMVRKNVVLEILENKKIKDSIGKYVNILENDAEIMANIISIESDIICRLLFYLIAIIILSSINFKITMLIFLLLMILTCLVFFLSSKIKIKHKIYREASIQYSVELENFVKNGSIVKQIDPNENYIKYLKNIINLKLSSTVSHHFFEKTVNNCYDYIYDLLCIIMLILFFLMNINDNISVGDMTLFLSYFSYGCTFFGLFTELFQNYKYFENLIDNIENDFQTERDQIVNVIDKKSLQDIKESLYKIEFSEFQLEKNDLSSDRYNFVFGSNTKILIVGDNDSTLNLFADCIFGYSDDFLGAINYFNKKGEACTNFKVGYIDSNNFIFLNNQVDNNQISDGKYSVLKSLGIYDLKNKQIKNNGRNFSEGQKQRLAIAQVLLGDYNMIVLNNCFSAIDNETVKSIHAFMKDKNVCIVKFSLSHDEYFDYDLIIDLCNNRIVNISTKNLI